MIFLSALMTLSRSASVRLAAARAASWFRSVWCSRRSPPYPGLRWLAEEIIEPVKAAARLP